MAKQKRKTGTREWAEVSKNIMFGCRNNCRYCYARRNACRFGQLSDPGGWTTMVQSAGSHAAFRKEKGRIMFPTAHDLFPDHLPAIEKNLRGWLDKGNSILIVTKPRQDVIEHLVDILDPSDPVVFRFTIGSMDDEILRFWEPGAPSFSERFTCLRLANSEGFITSVSSEPFLDGDVVRMAKLLLPYVSDSMWIGKMNRIRERVDVTGWSEQDLRFLSAVEIVQRDEAILEIYESLKDEPKIRWKDSVKTLLGLPEENIG